MLKVVSPFDLKLIKEIPYNTEQEVEKAIETAYNLFNNRNKWLPAYQRISILKKLASLLTEKIEETTKTAALEGGKPYADSKVEIKRAINGIELAINSIYNNKGEQVPMELTESSVNKIAFTTKEPIGVVVAISAFNHPVNLIIHQVVTAIAAGCPVIVKPASTTPISCLNLVDLIYEAGLPKEWCKVIICKRELTEKLATDPRVNFLTFIGSAKIGWYLRSKLANGTRCALEHGGIAPVIVEKDANISKLIPAILKGGFYHAGQVCVSVQRVFVHEDISEEVIKLLKEGAQKLVVGDPLDENTEVGPIIKPEELDRIDQWVKEAINEGAELICGGNKLPNNCYEPTILANPSFESKVSAKEVFGPVICIYTYSELASAIYNANNSNLHFQSSIFTNNINVALDTAKKLNANAIMINDHTAFRVDWMPFGGRDASGLGIGGIQHTINDMSREKLIVINQI